MGVYDNKGKLTGKLVYKISDVKKSGSSYTSNYVSEIFDKKDNTDTIKIYDSFIKSAYDKRDIEDLLQKINETINIDPNSKKYNIN